MEVGLVFSPLISIRLGHQERPFRSPKPIGPQRQTSRIVAILLRSLHHLHTRHVQPRFR